jgi:hypothetical protein
MNDEDMALLKDLNGQYLGGGPRLSNYGHGPYQPNTPIWNLPPIVTRQSLLEQYLSGASNTVPKSIGGKGLIITMTNSDQDDFIKNLITIRCELRAALAVPHPQAFCQVTGM